nr:MAG TPA: hypothetical protein [Caudoviricetes sp.]
MSDDSVSIVAPLFKLVTSTIAKKHNVPPICAGTICFMLYEPFKFLIVTF